MKMELMSFLILVHLQNTTAHVGFYYQSDTKYYHILKDQFFSRVEIILN